MLNFSKIELNFKKQNKSDKDKLCQSYAILGFMTINAVLIFVILDVF